MSLLLTYLYVILLYKRDLMLVEAIMEMDYAAKLLCASENISYVLSFADITISLFEIAFSRHVEYE